jgi:hypothetical protein
MDVVESFVSRLYFSCLAAPIALGAEGNSAAQDLFTRVAGSHLNHMELHDPSFSILSEAVVDICVDPQISLQSFVDRVRLQYVGVVAVQ